MVFDTNVLLSAFGWGGNPLRCVLLARAGLIKGLTCAEILEEVYEKSIEKLTMNPSDAFALVQELKEFLQVVPITGALRGAALAPEDDKVWNMPFSATQHTSSLETAGITSAGHFSWNTHWVADRVA